MRQDERGNLWFIGRKKDIITVPERPQVVASIPRNGTGKIDRKALLALAADASHGAVDMDHGTPVQGIATGAEAPRRPSQEPLSASRL
jgi:acyl-coenzyme A synthetase/AMP-(fatty) acid ligase